FDPRGTAGGRAEFGPWRAADAVGRGDRDRRRRHVRRQARLGGRVPCVPSRLVIPKISVDAPFTTLDIGASGHLQPPPAGDTNLVGWYAKGVSPGEKGTAVIAGHVDTTTSAAVFANLDG